MGCDTHLAGQVHEQITVHKVHDLWTQ